jgi:hypothetical protein
MKKLLLMTGSILLVLALLTPALVGLQLADISTQTRLQELTGQPALQLRLDNGWFASSGEIEVSSPVIGGVEYPTVILRADLNVQHGPLLLTPGGFGVGFVAATLHPELGSGFTDSVITVVAGFDGALHGLLENGSWSLEGSGTRTTLADLRVALDIQRSGQLSLEARSTRLSISDPFMALEILAPVLQLNSENLAHSPLPGTLGIFADEFAMVSQSAQAQNVTLQGIRLIYSASATPGVDGRGPTLNLRQNLEIDALQSSLAVTQLKVDARLEGIDQKLVVDYLTLLRDTQPLLSMMPPAELQAYVAAQSQDFTLGLAQHPFTQNTQVDFLLDGHSVRGELALHWPGEPSALTTRRVSLARALRVVRVTLALAVNEAAFAGGPLAPAVATYVTQGLLLRDQDTIVLNAGLHDGSLTLNNQRFPLEPFLRFLTPGQP